jgi:hypothetical protein
MRAALVFTPRVIDRTPMVLAFRRCHERLLDAIQGGRSQDAYHYARLVAFLGVRVR